MLELIKSRRSVREFIDKDIQDDIISQILEAGRWAPSGMNNQPWRFVIVKDKKIKQDLAKFTKYGRIIENGNVAIAVFIDNSSGYDRTKDVQAIGACIQNMLLEVHFLGLGACWIGEILNRRGDVEKFLQVPENFELMAVLVVGYPKQKNLTSKRIDLESLIYRKF